MKRIRNIVFDLGGVLIDLDHHQAVSRFEEIGVKDAKQLLDPYEQKGFFLELENGKIDVDTFCRKLCEHTGKQLSYDESNMPGWVLLPMSRNTSWISC